MDAIDKEQIEIFNNSELDTLWAESKIRDELSLQRLSISCLFGDLGWGLTIINTFLNCVNGITDINDSKALRVSMVLGEQKKETNWSVGVRP